MVTRILNVIFKGKYWIVNYRQDVVQSTLRTYSSCFTKILYCQDRPPPMPHNGIVITSN